MRDNRSATRTKAEIPDRGKSRFFGVYWSKNKKMWRVGTMIKGKRKHIGCYDAAATTTRPPRRGRTAPL